jgi:hypothetical protein
MNFNIGILIICTGKYQIFFDDLYNTCEKFFLTSHTKTYYVFTDAQINESHNVKIIRQENLGWPNNTMKRFEMFNSIYEKLSKEDYLFFFNANMLFVDYVSDEVIPKKKDNFLIGVHHPGYYNKNIDEYPYERRNESSLKIPFGHGKYYYQGCFNGGSSEKFLEMSYILANKINEDLKNGITPIYHDESAINWYFLKKNPLLMNCGYAYPSNIEVPFTKKIIQRNKVDYGGYDYLRTP